MKRSLSNVFVVLALASGVVLIGITAGLFPVAEPDPIEAVPLEKPKAVPLVTTPSLTNAQKVAPVAARASALTLCAAPDEGARLEVANGNTGTLSLFVWCRGGYGLFSLDLTSVAPLLIKLAHLPTNMPRPGGALVTDVTADGVGDLVVGVAPKEGVLHAPGSGVFLAKGRGQGGFEAAIALLEMPVIALGPARMRTAPAAPDLFVLTRGDAAARRPGQLVWFESGPTPLKKSTFNAGLSPRDLRLSQITADASPEWLVLASEPARVIALSPLKAAPDTSREVSLTDGAALCAASDPRFVLARTTHDLLRLNNGPALTLTPWFREANVGPCATGDLDRDGVPDALAVTDAGVIWLREGTDSDGAKEGASHELLLPAGYRAVDVAYAVSDAAEQPARVITLALDLDRKQLVLLIWSALPWADAATLSFELAPMREGASAAEIPLE